MTTNIWKYFKVIFIFLFYLLYNSLIVFILKKYGINITQLSVNEKIFINIGIYISLMLILYLIYRKDINKNIKDYIKNFKDYFKFGFKYWIIGLVIMILSNIVISYYYPGNSNNENLIFNYTMAYPLFMVFSSIIFAPFVEEIIFRKSLKELFTNDIIYIIVCGLVFGLAHTLAGTSTTELFYVIPYGAVGCMFAYIYSKTDNIFVSMTFHTIHNAIITGYYLILLMGVIK